MMNEHILTAILFDKSESFCIVKPFYNTFCHCPTPLWFVRQAHWLLMNPADEAMCTALTDQKTR
jgi:hypothetical protein